MKRKRLVRRNAAENSPNTIAALGDSTREKKKNGRLSIIDHTDKEGVDGSM